MAAVLLLTMAAHARGCEVVARLTTPALCVPHWQRVGDVVAFDKASMTAVDGGVEGGEPCVLLLPPVFARARVAASGSGAGSGAVSGAETVAPITQAIVMPVPDA